MKLAFDSSGVPVEHPLLGAGIVTGITELGPYPDAQVEETIEVMRERVREDAADPEFREYARAVARTPEQAWAHVKRMIGFERDESLGRGLGNHDTVEFIVRPREMARLACEGRAFGDCDDFSMYLAAILEANGIPCAFVTVAADGRVPDQYSHVYVRAYYNGEVIPLDASHGPYPGWEVPNLYGKLCEWPIAECGRGWRAVKDLLLIMGGVAGAVYLWGQFA